MCLCVGGFDDFTGTQRPYFFRHERGASHLCSQAELETAIGVKKDIIVEVVRQLAELHHRRCMTTTGAQSPAGHATEIAASTQLCADLQLVKQQESGKLQELKTSLSRLTSWNANVQSLADTDVQDAQPFDHQVWLGNITEIGDRLCFDIPSLSQGITENPSRGTAYYPDANCAKNCHVGPRLLSQYILPCVP